MERYICIYIRFEITLIDLNTIRKSEVFIKINSRVK